MEDTNFLTIFYVFIYRGFCPRWIQDFVRGGVGTASSAAGMGTLLSLALSPPHYGGQTTPWEKQPETFKYPNQVRILPKLPAPFSHSPLSLPLLPMSPPDLVVEGTLELLLSAGLSPGWQQKWVLLFEPVSRLAGNTLGGD